MNLKEIVIESNWIRYEITLKSGFYPTIDGVCALPVLKSEGVD